MANENGKDVANSLSSYSNALNKGTNAVLDSANQINKWYAEQVNKIADEENQDTRLETNVDNSIEEDTEEKINKIQTKVDEYTEIQTNNKNKLISNQNTGSRFDSSRGYQTYIKITKSFRNIKTNDKLPQTQRRNKIRCIN